MPPLPIPVLSDDAYLVAMSALAAVRGEGFPDPSAVPAMGVTDALHLHLATSLVAMGFPPLSAVWALNIGAVAAILWILHRLGGWRSAVLFPMAGMLLHGLLVGPGTGLFLLLALGGACSWGGKRAGWWAGLAVGVRLDAAPAWLAGGWDRWRRGDRKWVAQGIASVGAVLAANLLIWGSVLPVTLGAKGRMAERLAGLGESLPSPLPWLILPLALIAVPGWRGAERRLLLAGAGLALAWWGVGFPPGSVVGLAGGLVWMACSLRAPRMPWPLFAMMLLLGISTFPAAGRGMERWADHRDVARRAAAVFPERGCTVAFWYLGYLRDGTERCLADGSGFFDPKALALLEETGTADIFLVVDQGRIRAAVQFFPSGDSPAERMAGFPHSIRLEGKSLTAVVYFRDAPASP